VLDSPESDELPVSPPSLELDIALAPELLSSALLDVDGPPVASPVVSSTSPVVDVASPPVDPPSGAPSMAGAEQPRSKTATARKVRVICPPEGSPPLLSHSALPAGTDVPPRPNHVHKGDLVMAWMHGFGSALAVAALVVACSDDGTVTGSGDETAVSTTDLSTGTATEDPSGDPTTASLSSSGSSSEPETGSSSEGSSSEGSSSGGGSESSSGTVDGSSSSSGGSTGSSSESGAMTTTGLEEGECNETLGVGCEADEYCDYPDDDCGASEHGVCTPRPNACTDEYDPHCGCDGVTHGNSCEAPAAGTDVDHAGAC
jgi:hypothetical protein